MTGEENLTETRLENQLLQESYEFVLLFMGIDWYEKAEGKHYSE